MASNSRPVYRRHAPAFKEQVCREIRSGLVGRREAQQRYGISDNLIHRWLQRYDSQHPAVAPAADSDLHTACAEQIHALERKIGELVMALERARGEAP